jgi:hypothetical protein
MLLRCCSVQKTGAPAHPELWGASHTWTDGKDTVLTRMGIADNCIELRYNKSPVGRAACQ